MKAWISRLTKKAKNQEGLTLIELLAVVVILGIIAAVAVPITLNAIDNSKENTTMSEVAELQTALDRYAQDHDGQFPTSATGLLGNGGVGDYITQFDGNDAWGMPIQYSSDGSSYTIWAPKKAGSTGVLASNTSSPQAGKTAPPSPGGNITDGTSTQTS